MTRPATRDSDDPLASDTGHGNALSHTGYPILTGMSSVKSHHSEK